MELVMLLVKLLEVYLVFNLLVDVLLVIFVFFLLLVFVW